MGLLRSIEATFSSLAKGLNVTPPVYVHQMSPLIRT